MNTESSQKSHQCEACGTFYDRMEAFCKPCKRWDTIQATNTLARLAPVLVHPTAKRKTSSLRSTPIGKVEETEQNARFSTGTPALDHVIGGGLVPGATIIVSGDPGIGKSTLLLRIAADISEHKKVFYATAEEEEVEIYRRAQRIDAVRDDLHLLASKDFDEIEAEVMNLLPEVIILDSLSTMQTDPQEKAGSVGEVQRLGDRIVEMSKQCLSRPAVFIVMHVNKSGEIAGPQSVQHLFTASLFLESTGRYQTLRAIKSRLGPLASSLFEMTSRGMEAVENPSERFLIDRIPGAAGSTVGALCEDNSRIPRTTLFECQALVGKPKPNGTRRLSSNGVDKERLHHILDVLEKTMSRAFPGALAACDIRVNIPGGLQVKEPASDLPIALAIISSFLDQPVPEDTIAFGEIGLAGEIRGVDRAEPRINEAKTMGFSRAITPHGGGSKMKKFQVEEVRTLEEALRLSFKQSDAAKPKVQKRRKS